MGIGDKTSFLNGQNSHRIVMFRPGFKDFKGPEKFVFKFIALICFTPKTGVLRLKRVTKNIYRVNLN